MWYISISIFADLFSHSKDSQDGGQSFYKCPDSNPPTYCCHEEGCNCAKGAEFKLPSAAPISLIADPLKSSMVSRSVTRVPTVDDSQTITSNLVSVVTVTDAPTSVLVATYTVVPSATSQQSTSISGAQVTSSQSPQASQAGGAAPKTSGARNFNVNFVVPAVALAISALVLLLLHHWSIGGEGRKIDSSNIRGGFWMLQPPNHHSAKATPLKWIKAGTRTWWASSVVNVASSRDGGVTFWCKASSPS